MGTAGVNEGAVQRVPAALDFIDRNELVGGKCDDICAFVRHQGNQVEPVLLADKMCHKQNGHSLTNWEAFGGSSLLANLTDSCSTMMLSGLCHVFCVEFGHADFCLSLNYLCLYRYLTVFYWYTRVYLLCGLIFSMTVCDLAMTVMGNKHCNAASMLSVGVADPWTGVSPSLVLASRLSM